MWEPYAALRRGEIDVLVNWLAVDEPDLTAGVVIEHRDRVLAVGRGHRLANYRTHTLSRSVTPLCLSSVPRAARSGAASPRTVRTTSSR